MNGWIILAIATAGFIACYRIAYRFIDESEDGDYGPDKVDQAFPIIMALLISMMWPAVLIGWAVWLIATPTTARQRRQQVRELEERKAQLKREIADAERELGIGKDKP